MKGKFWDLDNSYVHALLGAIGAAFLSSIITFIILDQPFKLKEISLTFVISIVFGAFTYLGSLIKKLISILSLNDNIIFKINEFVDDRIRRFYKDIIDDLKKFEQFTSFIIEITNEKFLKKDSPTLGEIDNKDYREIIQKAVSFSKKNTFCATLTDEYLPDWFFNNTGGMTSSKKINYLGEMERLEINAKRLMIFTEEALKNSFLKLTPVQKAKFLNLHNNIKLFWIDSDNFIEITGFDILTDKHFDCAIIDNKIGLLKQDNVLKIIVDDAIQHHKRIFEELEKAINANQINNNFPFKDKSFIEKYFKAKDENPTY